MMHSCFLWAGRPRPYGYGLVIISLLFRVCRGRVSLPLFLRCCFFGRADPAPTVVGWYLYLFCFACVGAGLACPCFCVVVFFGRADPPLRLWVGTYVFILCGLPRPSTLSYPSINCKQYSAEGCEHLPHK